MTEKGQKYYKGKKHHWAFLAKLFKSQQNALK